MDERQDPKEAIAYCVTIGDILLCTCFDDTKMSSQSLGMEGKWINCKHLYYAFRFLCKVVYNIHKFIHAPTYSYNEVMRLLEPASVSNVPNVVFNHMFKNSNKWYVFVKISNVLIVFESIHGNRLPSFLFYQYASTYNLKDWKMQVPIPRVCTLKPYIFTKFGRYYCSLLTCYRSPLIAHVLASLVHVATMSHQILTIPIY